jgi:phosphohistidine phosphatase
LKDLLLLRHAKSGWDNPGLADIDRPLSKRGRKAGVRLQHWFTARKCRPALILCSSARRTRETLDQLLPAWPKPPEIRYLERLYLAEPDELLACLYEVSDATPSALLIGHNPGLQELALQLLPESQADIRTRIDMKFPTGALIRLSSRARSWSRLVPGKLKLVEYVTPAELQD